MSKFFAIKYTKNNREQRLKAIRDNSMLLMKRMEIAEPGYHYSPTESIFSPFRFCTGTWANQAIGQLLSKDDVGEHLCYFMLREDARILDVEFDVVVAPGTMKVEIV